jgi:hypothetical protein
MRDNKLLSEGPARELVEKEVLRRQAKLADSKRKERETLEAAQAKQRQAKSIELEQALANDDLVGMKACLDYLSAEIKHLTPAMQERLSVISNQFRVKLDILKKKFTDQLIDAKSGEEIETIRSEIISSPLMPDVIAQINEMADLRAAKYKKLDTPVDENALWQAFAKALNDLRGDLFYAKVKTLAEAEAGKFATPESKALIMQFATIGQQASTTEGLLRNYVKEVNPEVTIQVQGKPTLVTLKAIDKSVTYSVKSVKSDAGAVETTEKRSAVSLPLRQLLEKAFAFDGSVDENRAEKTASFLWLWRDNAAAEMFAAIPNSMSTLAVAQIERISPPTMNGGYGLRAAVAERNGSQTTFQYGNERHPWYLDDFIGEDLTIFQKTFRWSTNKAVDTIKKLEADLPTVRWKGQLYPPFRLTASVEMQPNTLMLLFGVQSREHRVRIGFQNLDPKNTKCTAYVTEGNEFKPLPRKGIYGVVVSEYTTKSNAFLKVDIVVNKDYQVGLFHNDIKLIDEVQLPKGKGIIPIIQAVQKSDQVTSVVINELILKGELPNEKDPE